MTKRQNLDGAAFRAFLPKLVIPLFAFSFLSGCGVATGVVNMASAPFTDCPITSQACANSVKVGNTRIWSSVGNGGAQNATLRVVVVSLPDLERTPSGEIKTSDTPNNFKRWKALIDAYVQVEAQGASPPDPQETWKSYWTRNFDLMRQRQINVAKYIAYAVKARQAHDLPALGS